MGINGRGGIFPLGRKAAVGVLIVLLCMVFFIPADLGASGEEPGKKGWIATDTFRMMNFVVLAVALVLILRKPFSQALRSRIQGIKTQLQDLEVRKAEAEKQLAEYNEKLSRLEKESAKIVDDYIKQGQEARARILKEAESAAEKLKVQARRNIEHEFEEAKLRLQAEIIEKSLAKAKEILKRKITTEDQEGLVDEYLKKVVAG
jgi:F-type H+-transporting ATPase subunit b